MKSSDRFQTRRLSFKEPTRNKQFQFHLLIARTKNKMKKRKKYKNYDYYLPCGRRGLKLRHISPEIWPLLKGKWSPLTSLNNWKINQNDQELRLDEGLWRKWRESKKGWKKGKKKTPKYEKNCQKWDDRGKKMEKKKLKE